MKANRAMVVLGAGCVMCLLGAGMMIGTIATLAWVAPAAAPLAELPLHATATDTGVSMSMASGPIDEEMEGVFFLDFLTGTLGCAVINSRQPTLVAGRFVTNVIKDLAIVDGKKPAYLMVTGGASFKGKGVASQPGRCVVYVLDQNSGNFAAYGLEWNRNEAAVGRLQEGALVKLVAGNARVAKVED